jgi:hypothetical protein
VILCRGKGEGNEEPNTLVGNEREKRFMNRQEYSERLTLVGIVMLRDWFDGKGERDHISHENRLISRHLQ